MKCEEILKRASAEQSEDDIALAGRLAKMWTGYLGCEPEITAEQALMMIGLLNAAQQHRNPLNLWLYERAAGCIALAGQQAVKHYKVFFSDGGRKAAGYKGRVNDCVIRAIAIATESDYKFIYKSIHDLQKNFPYSLEHHPDLFTKIKERSPRFGVRQAVWRPFAESMGFKCYPILKTKSDPPITINTNNGQIPTNKNVLLQFDEHIAAFVDGVLHDNTGDKYLDEPIEDFLVKEE